MKKILFIDRYQFGYTTDSLKYCEYLNKKYKIRYISFDFGWKKIQVPNINVIYIPRIGNLVIRAVIFILAALYNILFFHSFIFILYFPKCSILKRIIFWKKMHIDVRTLSVMANPEEREKSDQQMQKDLYYFDSSSFITQGIKQKISLPKKQKSFILPLGADIISTTNKSFEELNLLYVGTLFNRNIIETVKGVIDFVKSHPNIKIHYDIIGDGINDEIKELSQLIKNKKAEKYITLHGRLPYYSLQPFFDTHNIGISFIPITDYYAYQPPTKTYEYILSGLFCMATATIANQEIITTTNGILHQDNAKSFTEALEKILKNRHLYNSVAIRETLLNYQWGNIINNYLLPIIEQNHING